jgi:hypothetical protein
LAWRNAGEDHVSQSSGQKKTSKGIAKLTGLADRLVATRKTKSIHCQLVADGTSQLEWNFILGQSAGFDKLSAREAFERG